MLDKLSPLVRDFLFLVGPALVAFAGTELVPLLQGVNPIAATLAAGVLSQLALILTKLTTQYGKGSPGGTRL